MGTQNQSQLYTATFFTWQGRCLFKLNTISTQARMRRVVVSGTNTSESILLPRWHARCPANGTEPVEGGGVALQHAQRDCPHGRRGPREINRRTVPSELSPPSIDK
ncbi:unnamed protein product [Ectocarpus sp. 12 AP-2014]